MREYILDFLSRQKPGLIYHQEEQHGVFSYIWRVWLSRTGEVLSSFTVYTPISVVFTEQGMNNKMIGPVDNSFYGKLERGIKRHVSVEDAVANLVPDLTEFTSRYLYTCDALKKKVESRALSYADGKLLRFDCLDARLGIFSLLFEIDRAVECCTFILGRKNVIDCSIERARLEPFFEHLFGELFDIVWITENVWRD